MSVQNEIIEVKVDEAMLQAIEIKLKGMKSKASRVLKNVVNATARDTKKNLATKAQEQYTIKANRFKKQIKQKNASISKPEALLQITGQMNKLESFQIRKNTKVLGAKVRVKNDSILKELISRKGVRSFQMTVDNGEGKKSHTFIAQRVGKSQYPVKGFYGPSDPEMIGNEKVYGKVKPDIYKLLYKNINKQIDKILGGK